MLLEIDVKDVNQIVTCCFFDSMILHCTPIEKKTRRICQDVL